MGRGHTRLHRRAGDHSSWRRYVPDDFTAARRHRGLLQLLSDPHPCSGGTGAPLHHLVLHRPDRHRGVQCGAAVSLDNAFPMARGTHGRCRAVGRGGHLYLIRAAEHASPAVLAPFSYSQLVWSTLFAFIAFNEFPDRVSLMGMLIIVLAGMLAVNFQRAFKLKLLRWR